MANVNLQGLLKDAVRLHQSGKLEQAGLLYWKVLATQPGNADALHLLGMIALQQGQAARAAEMIRKAIALYDRDASYHFHLALALQTLGDMEGALAGYRRALKLAPDDPGIHNNLGNVLRSQGAREEAEVHFRRAIALQPGFAEAFVNLGNLHRDAGALDAAVECYSHAAALAPRNAAAHCSRGAALWQMGRRDEARACYRTALAIDPGHVETLIHLAHAHWDGGALDEAEALHVRALALRPYDPDACNSLAALRLARGDSAGAAEMIRRSLAMRETPGARALFVQLAQRLDWNGGDDEWRAVMVRALAEPWDRPAALSRAAAWLIRSGPVLGPLVARADTAWPKQLSLRELLGDAGFAALAEDALLMALLPAAPNTNIALERFLTMLRGAMLRELADAPPAPQAMRFAAALAQQCFINEYVFPADAVELAAARALWETAPVIAPMPLLLVASYFPLHNLPRARDLVARSWPTPVEAVLSQQVRAPFEEQRLRATIPRLTRIEDPVSRLVQKQYEENPYPRWVRPAPAAPDNIANFLSGKFPLAGFERPSGPMRDILIAGCGTGQRSIAMARKFGDRQMLAMDISLASLAYARRKSEELGLKINYAQADILELKADRQFDIIESLGVLHHLADPYAGWSKLLPLLRPGGLMLLGLYSERARRPVVEARRRITAKGLSGSPDDIRKFRQELLAEGDAALHASILTSEDFFTLSGCRDLLFHVQEHHTTLVEIARFLDSHGLRFLGFELDEAVLAAYRQRFPQDPAATSLNCWDAFEADHPGLFGGLYAFWVQKPAAAPGN